MVTWVLKDNGSAPRLPDRVIMDRALGSSVRVLLTAFIVLGGGALLFVQEPDRTKKFLLLRAMAVTILCPIYWNGISRFEYRTLLLTRVVGGDRAVALSWFAASILALSTYREHCFFAVATPGRDELLASVPGIWILATFLLAFGTILSTSDFVQLGVKGTYMGECFGYFCPSLITTLPFNVFKDPMYLGSSLMHVGWALRSRSALALYVAVLVWVTYWITARVFEGPFTSQLYSFQPNLSAEAKLHRAESK